MSDQQKPQPIASAPKNGGWILGHVPKNAAPPWDHPWIILTWGDTGWRDDRGDQHEPIEWVPLPDPQPHATGWTPPTGVIKMEEITGEGWTCNGQPSEVPWRWLIFIEKPDGSYDEYRDTDFAVTAKDAERKALKWQERYSLPIARVPLDRRVIPFRPAGVKS